MLGPLSMAKPAPSAKILPPLIHKRFVCRWTSGRFASMMSTRLTSLGRPLNRFEPMLADNYAAYDRNKSRGVPRDGAALLHGIVYCGACGHKMMVQYKHGTRYLCNALRQQYHVPVCQCIPADSVDQYVVELFFQALSPVELDVYAAAVATQQATTQQITHAHQQHLERLRYEAALAQRQFNRVDPDNRLVAAELEKRWETALVELKRAEEAQAPHGPSPNTLLALSSELQAAFGAIGQHLPTRLPARACQPAPQKGPLTCIDRQGGGASLGS